MIVAIDRRARIVFRQRQGRMAESLGRRPCPNRRCAAMSYDLTPFASIPLDRELLELLIHEHETITVPRLSRLWSYYRNALAEPTPDGGSSGPPAQMAGLPPRLTDPPADESTHQPVSREIVIENDIGWRVQTLVDFMFPDSPKIISRAVDAGKAGQIEAILDAVITANGGTALWQDAALLGSVYGHVDFLLNCHHLSSLRPGRAPSVTASSDPPRRVDRLIEQIGSRLVIETVEAPRAIALLNRSDYRKLDAYIIHFEQLTNDVSRGGWLQRLSRSIRNRPPLTQRASVTVTEIHSATHCQRYEDEQLVTETVNRLGRIPVVHVQNLSQPLDYHGLSDVEPLIPLQDELNTRLSDRANRVTMQSFRMWLAKGIDDFTDHPIGPGQMWATDNLDASIEPFGGDADSPSEKQHIEELREALDKTSGVTPAAAGHIKARVGNLTSENALRISLMGTIAKTKRKRVTYGAGIRELCELILHALDVYGILRTHPGERDVEVVWSDPIASDESRRIADALAKAQLGVPASILRAELGYPDAALPPAQQHTV
jgi:hypothetical protein